MKTCSRCHEIKASREFSQNMSWCKSCVRQYQKQRRTNRRFNPLELLYRSCESAVARGRATSGRYKSVSCVWKSPAKMRDDLAGNELFWSKWILLCDAYKLSGGQRNMRPTIDRIDEQGDYEIGNIDALSKKDNTLKATQKSVFVFNWETWSFTEYPSQKLAKVHLGQGYKAMDKGISFSPDGTPYIIQSQSITHDKSKLVGRRYANMNNEQVVAEIKRKLIKARKIIRGLKTEK